MDDQIQTTVMPQEIVTAIDEREVQTLPAMSAETINALQSGESAAPGMPEQAKDISPVEMSAGEMFREFLELKARFNMLESRYNELCREKGFSDYVTMS